MKKFLSTLMLTFAVAAGAQQAPCPQQQGPQKTKTIADQAEYNAYLNATSIQDPAQKAKALEDFAQTYPNTIVKEEVLEAAMGAYQQAGNAAKVSDVAQKLLQVNPNNVVALAVQVYAKRIQALSSAQPNAQLLNDAADMGKRGMAALPCRIKPEGMAQPDFDKQQKLFTSIFSGAVANAAWTGKDYPGAIKSYQDALAAAPGDVTNEYQLAMAYLQPKPNTDDNILNGLWWMAKTINSIQAQNGNPAELTKVGKFYYKRYHGTEEGWDQFVASAKDQNAPPSNLAATITKYTPPTPAQQIQEWLSQKKPEEMGWGEWVFILTNGSQEQKDQVWNAIKDHPLKFEGKVQSAEKGSVTMSVTEDGIQANVPEVTVTMLNPMRIAPPGGTEHFKVQAVPTEYTPQPFMVMLGQGQPIGDSIQLTGGGAATKGGKAGKAAPKTKAKTKAKAKR